MRINNKFGKQKVLLILLREKSVQEGCGVPGASGGQDLTRAQRLSRGQRGQGEGGRAWRESHCNSLFSGAAPACPPPPGPIPTTGGDPKQLAWLITLLDTPGGSSLTTG